MSACFPGTVIETSKLEVGASRTLFAGIFAGGGIALSQVSSMTGLEPYVIQNWVKRGFVSPPQRRVYSSRQFARIVIINMLRQTLQIEHITALLSYINGSLSDESDDLIPDDELYHRYVDAAATLESCESLDASAVDKAAAEGCTGFGEGEAQADAARSEDAKRLYEVLRVMAYAHMASEARRRALELASALDI